MRRWWYASARIWAAATLTGVVTAVSWIGFTAPSMPEAAGALLLGASSAFAVVLVEGVIRSAVRRVTGTPAEHVHDRDALAAADPEPSPRQPATRRSWLWRPWQWLPRILDWLRWRTRANSAIAYLPRPRTVFRSREAVLADLRTLHDSLRRERLPMAMWWLSREHRQRIATGTPVIILIHGKAGTGKSDMANALANDLKDDYPNGLIYVNLGTAGVARPEADILKTCLDALKWPLREIPHDTAERAKLFRSLTSQRRLLFVFDAARNHDQLEQVLPIGTGCAVIVTSRRDLSLRMPTIAAYRLREPDPDEAIDILRATAKLRSESQPEAAAEIARACGRLPIALSAAGERVAQGSTLADVAVLLRDETSRLGVLDTQNRKVNDRISSEYHRLLDVERRILQWLTVVPCDTFDSTAMQVMKQIPRSDADSYLAHLAEVRLLDVVAAATDDTPVRYRYGPLVRLLALRDWEQQAAPEQLDTERQDMLRCWDADVLARFTELLARHGGEPDQLAAEWLDRVRTEYPAVLRAIRLAHAQGRWRTCWQIAARVGRCVAGNIPVDVAAQVFDLGIEAAVRDGAVLGEIDTRTAKASYLVEVERYPDAFAELHTALSLLDTVTEAGLGDGAVARRRAIVHRCEAEAYMQSAEYRLATGALNKASATRWLHDDQHQQLALILRSELYHVTTAREATFDDGWDEQVDDVTRYRNTLVLAEIERRHRNWAAAIGYLTDELRRSTGDLRRQAGLNYRLARLYIDESQDQPAFGQALITLAIRRSTEAVVTFKEIDDVIGVIRARILLARALMKDSTLILEAQSACDRATADLLHTMSPTDIGFLPLAARILRTRGDLLLHWRDRAAALRDLSAASRLFGQAGDHATQTTVLKDMRRHVEAYGYPAGSWPTPPGLR